MSIFLLLPLPVRKWKGWIRHLHSAKNRLNVISFFTGYVHNSSLHHLAALVVVEKSEDMSLRTLLRYKMMEGGGQISETRSGLFVRHYSSIWIYSYGNYSTGLIWSKTFSIWCRIWILGVVLWMGAFWFGSIKLPDAGL